MCSFASLAEEDRHLAGRAESIGEMWATERVQLLPLPSERFDTAVRVSARLDPKGRLTVLRNRYSAPVKLAGLVVEAVVNSSDVSRHHGGKEVGRHPRQYGIGGDRLVLDHYLEVLRFKPRALAGSVPLRQAIADGSFPAPYITLFDELQRRHGLERRRAANGRRAVLASAVRSTVGAHRC